MLRAVWKGILSVCCGAVSSGARTPQVGHCACFGAVMSAACCPLYAAVPGTVFRPFDAVSRLYREPRILRTRDNV